MIGDLAAMRAWLDAHGLADAELLHQLPNQGPDGRELTDSERQLLSALLEARRLVVPGYRPAPADRPTTQDRPGPAELLDLFDPGPTRPRSAQWLSRPTAAPSDRCGRRRGTTAHRRQPGDPAHRDREEERER
jgi:hypothetical protein